MAKAGGEASSSAANCLKSKTEKAGEGANTLQPKKINPKGVLYSQVEQSLCLQLV